MYASNAILAALHARQNSGEGQTIDVPLFDSQVAWLANQSMNYLVGGKVPSRHGNAHPNIVPYQSFATADGFIMLAVGNDRQFVDCLRCLGIPELATDARFSSNEDRVANRQELLAVIEPLLIGKTTAEWQTAFNTCGVPCGPINDLEQVFTGEQVAERELLQSLPHPLAGEVPTVANPVRMSATPPELRSAPPLLGQHTDEILAEKLGYSQKEIEELRTSGAI